MTLFVSIAGLFVTVKLAAGGVISSSLCKGCAESDECFDFDETANFGQAGKFLGCYGEFTGADEMDDVCGNSHSATSVQDAMTAGFDGSLCSSFADAKLLFFFKEGYDTGTFTCPSEDSNADNDAGLWGCRGTSSTWCPLSGGSCGVATANCFNDVSDGFGGPKVLNGTGSFATVRLLDSIYGGVICIRDPTFAPSEVPSNQPSVVPSMHPSDNPTTEPSEFPTTEPSEFPSVIPTINPSEFPSEYPTLFPSDPTFGPSFVPTTEPTLMPSVPTIVPSKQPSDMPTDTLPPTRNPSSEPSDLPSVSPSDVPTTEPSDEPTTYPSLGPTNQPTDDPTKMPTKQPIEVVGGTGTKEDSGLIGSLSDELSYLIIAGGACLLCILIAVIVVCMKKKQNEKATQGGNSTEMAGMTAFKVHSDGATPNNSHYQEDRDEFHISNMTQK